MAQTDGRDTRWRVAALYAIAYAALALDIAALLRPWPTMAITLAVPGIVWLLIILFGKRAPETTIQGSVATTLSFALPPLLGIVAIIESVLWRQRDSVFATWLLVVGGVEVMTMLVLTGLFFRARARPGRALSTTQPPTDQDPATVGPGSSPRPTSR